MHRLSQALCATALLVSPALSQSSTVVGFDGGGDGGFTGNAFFESVGGNPDGTAHHAGSFFFNEIRTGGLGEPSNASFLGDFSAVDDVTFGFDVKVDSITNFFGGEIPREVGIALIDRDIQGPSGASGVFFSVGALSSSAQPDWTTLSVTVDDPTSSTLPAGWVGFGDEDPMTFAPILPAGATFATVLAGVDEFRISGAIPGFFFTNAIFDVRIDNVSVTLGDSGPMNYCTPGAAGAIMGLGAGSSTSVGSNTFALEASPVPNNFGIFYMGMTQTSQAFGDCSVRCIASGPTVRRWPAAQATGGVASRNVDLTVDPGDDIAAGSTWNFQYWFRDPLNCTSGFDLSDGLQVTFLP